MTDVLHLIGDSQPDVEWPDENSPIYLAGPVSGISEYNAPVFTEARDLLIAHGYPKVINPVDLSEDYDKFHGIERGSETWQIYMRIGIKEMAGAGSIILLPGWAQSRGAMAELTLATSLQMGVYLMFPKQKLLVQTSRPKKSRH
jgi:hypothetical protein